MGVKFFVQRPPDIASRWKKAVVLRTLPDQSCEVEIEDGVVFRRSAVHMKLHTGTIKQPEEFREPDTVSTQTTKMTTPTKEHHDQHHRESRQTVSEWYD